MDVDQFQELVEAEGMSSWRRPEWPESGGMSSKVAAHQYRIVFDLLNRYAPPGEPLHVLDWGSGSCAFSYALLEQGHQVDATDFAVPPKEEFLTSRAAGRFTFTRCADAVALPFPDGNFDLVLSIGCLEHVRETGGSDTGSLAEIARVLKVGGTFICAHLPNRYSYIEGYVRFFDRPGRFYHRFRYTPREIREKAGAAGLEVTDLTAYGALPRNPLSRLPARVRDAPVFIRSYDAADDLLAALAGGICQNFAWAGVKRA